MTTLSGPFGGILEAAALTLADTPAFRVWVDPDYDTDADLSIEEEAAARAAAYAHVHFYTQRSTGWTRPAVLISLDPSTRLERPAQGFGLWPSGAVNMMFENTFSSDLHSEMLTFMDDIFGIISGMATTIEGDTTGTYLQAQWFAPQDKPAASDLLQGEPTKYLQWVWQMGVGA